MPLHTAKETLGADQRAVVPHLKMAVVAGGNTGGPHITNDVTALNRLPHTASLGRHMPVKRGPAVPMVNHNIVAITPMGAGRNNLARIRGIDRRTIRRTDISAIVVRTHPA